MSQLLNKPLFPPTTKQGLVYILRTSPDDPELITVRGLRALRHSDVIVYDYLANHY